MKPKGAKKGKPGKTLKKLCKAKGKVPKKSKMKRPNY